MALFGCFRTLISLAFVVIIAGIAWLERDRLAEYWHELRGTPVAQQAALAPPTVTPAIAERAQAELDAMARGEAMRTTLSQDELLSLLRFRYEQLLPPFIDSARVELDGDRIRLRGRMPVERLPRVDELGEVAGLLPDTTDLAVTGQLLPLDDRHIAFAIDDVRAGHIPLPRRIVPALLERLGRRDEPGLPRDAVALPLPPGIASAYVRADSLVLLANTASRNGN